MLTTIQFDCQSPFDTARVYDKGSEWMLAAKLSAANLSIARPRPKPAFDISLRPA
jgi:hypothetical protein